MGQIAALRFHPLPLWFLGVDGVFGDLRQMAVFLSFPLWFPGFGIATGIFVILGALGRFLALPHMADDVCFSEFWANRCFLVSPLKILGFHCVFGDFGQVVVFRPFPLWFLGF